MNFLCESCMKWHKAQDLFLKPMADKAWEITLKQKNEEIDLLRDHIKLLREALNDKDKIDDNR